MLMTKIQELVKNGKLSQNLMADKEFVNKAKEIFKSENINIDDKNLAKLMVDFEARLKKSNILDDKELEQISGGKIKLPAGRKSTFKGMCAIVGMSICGFILSDLGGMAGKKAVRLTIKPQALPEATVESLMKERELGGDWGGSAAGALSGMSLGGILGYTLGELIWEKSGAYEEQES